MLANRGLGVDIKGIPHIAHWYTPEPPLGISGLTTHVRQGGMGIIGVDPISIAVGGGLQLGEFLFNKFSQPSITGMQAQDATTIVNGIEPILKANVASFMSSAKTSQQQAQALAVFDSAWQQIISACGNLAGPGTKCVNDRAPGGKFDWWKAYRDPIANTVPSDSSIVGPNVAITQDSTGASSSGGISTFEIMLGVLTLAMGVIAMSKGGS